MPLETSGRTATASRIFTAYALTPGATTDILTASNGHTGTGFILPRMCGVLRLLICCTGATKVLLTSTDGTTAYTDSVLNDNVALVAKAPKLLEWPAPATTTGLGVDDSASGTNITWNLQLDTNVVIRFMTLDYVTGPLV